ncbi:EamA domain-containing membrane protein RarD [Thermoactinomyces sp. DSM 45891]|uniref:DMT family transporter n=1 Tax=Thermoactinomyces sp. DSM 45891 TaxID=1761907 RepID=UPI00091C82BC|nr:DMT family transporter [Thermoactinomyces sp. DSM 45891]SFX57107.1 EamA domain-containing membrane protein RarD [Thermoactinomyces sp. DSM 45891]
MKKISIIPVIALLLAVILWGYNFIVTKLLLVVLSPFVLAFYAIFGAAIISVLIFWRGLFSYDKKILVKIFFASFFGIFLFNLLVNFGMKKTSSVDAALIIALVPLISNILDVIWLKNPLRAINIFGTLLSITGIVLLVTNGEFGSVRFSDDHLYGSLILFVAVISFVIYISLGKSIMNSINPIHYSTWCFIFGSGLLFIPAFIWGDLTAYKNLDHTSLLYVLFAILFANLVADMAYNFGVKKTNIIIPSLFSNSIPIFTMLFSIFVYNEPISNVKIIAACFVIIGLALPTIANRNESVKI